MDLKNISVAELFSNENEFMNYHNTLKFLLPKPILKFKKINSLTELTFGEVVEVRMNLNDFNFENIIKIFNTAFGVDKKQFLKIKVVDFYHAWNWIKNEIETISKREFEKLQSNHDSKLKDAGIDELNIFGEMNTLIMLGKEYSKSPQEVEGWNYNLVFSLMLHSKISNEIQKKYYELNKTTNE